MTRRHLHQLTALAAALLIPSSCEDDPSTVEDPAAFTITSGACGDLIFQENLGPDSATAVAEIERRTVEQYPSIEVALELFGVEVVDEEGQVPEPRFYGVLVRDADTGSQFVSPVDVFNTLGDLFWLRWCPD